jgi:hypothetical protein
VQLHGSLLCCKIEPESILSVLSNIRKDDPAKAHGYEPFVKPALRCAVQKPQLQAILQSPFYKP